MDRSEYARTIHAIAAQFFPGARSASHIADWEDGRASFEAWVEAPTAEKSSGLYVFGGDTPEAAIDRFRGKCAKHAAQIASRARVVGTDAGAACAAPAESIARHAALPIGGAL